MRINQTVIRRGLLAFVPLFIACSAAPQQAAPIVGSVAGTARFLDATAHAGIRVAVRGTDHVAITDEAGTFLIDQVAPGSYTLEASAEGYVTATADVRVAANVRSQMTLALGRPLAGTVTVSGRVMLADGADPSGAAVLLDGTSAVAFTSADGSFSIDGVAPGTYALEVRRPGYVSLQKSVSLSPPVAISDPSFFRRLRQRPERSPAS